MSQFLGQFPLELFLLEAPAPVAAIQTGSIHAGLAAKAEHVLQGDNAEIRRGTLRRADERPVNAVLATANIGLGVAPLVLRRGGIPPAYYGVVVVRAGVDDFACGAVRQVHMRTFIAKAKLQDGHPRNLQPIP